jgi:Dienelactone hydrolase family
MPWSPRSLSWDDASNNRSPPPSAVRRARGRPRGAGLLHGGSNHIPARGRATGELAGGRCLRIDAELTCHGQGHEFQRYEGAGHAFLNFTNLERYQAAQGKDAWEKMLGFLDRQVKEVSTAGRGSATRASST